jgi:hypothetical protein
MQVKAGHENVKIASPCRGLAGSMPVTNTKSYFVARRCMTGNKIAYCRK